jgi:predicted ATP-grasp superfamily ATP-dependent carboligase
LDGDNLLVFGASARAAAFSALRAGLRPWCADLFADADLRAVCPAMRLPARYPYGFLDLVGVELPGPWMYTGGLENRLLLVQRMARMRPLWGNGRRVLLRCRHPGLLSEIVCGAGLPFPELQWYGTTPPPDRRWLLKPLAGSGGTGIRVWSGQRPRSFTWPPQYYLQEFIEGESWSAIYAGDGRGALLLGVTRQLVGAEWLHAAPFQYCGSLGPLLPPEPLSRQLLRLGTVLASGCGLRGLFGVDGVERGGVFWPVEVNPRYTASVEVIEHGTGLRTLAWHRRAFDPEAPEPPLLPAPTAVIGKAILFARETLAFPADGPWNTDLAAPSIHELPGFADLPTGGERIEAGRPILSFFTRAADAVACERALREMAAGLDRWLYRR